MPKTKDLQKRSTEILTNASEKPAPRKRGGSPKGRPAPWMEANDFARTHGFYADQMTPEELADRAAWVSRVIEQKGKPSEIKRGLIEQAGWLRLILNRTWNAVKDGKGGPASEHMLAMLNSYRLICSAIGLEAVELPGQSLQDYLAQKEQNHTDQERPQ